MLPPPRCRPSRCPRSPLLLPCASRVRSVDRMDPVLRRHCNGCRRVSPRPHRPSPCATPPTAPTRSSSPMPLRSVTFVCKCTHLCDCLSLSVPRVARLHAQSSPSVAPKTQSRCALSPQLSLCAWQRVPAVCACLRVCLLQAVVRRDLLHPAAWAPCSCAVWSRRRPHSCPVAAALTARQRVCVCPVR